MDKSTSIARCFTSARRSNESQCPMLSKFTSSKNHNNQKKKNQQQQSTPSTKNLIKHKQRKTSTKSSAAVNLLAAFKSTNHSNNSPSNSSTTGQHLTTNTNQKKLRFQLAKERKASTTLGIIMSAFTFCWLPFFVLALVRPFLSDQSENAIPHTLSSLFLWLGYANSLLNPIIYATLNRDFRKPFQEILYFRCGSLNHMMREEFYHSQYGDPEQQTYCGNVIMTSTTVSNVKQQVPVDGGGRRIAAAGDEGARGGTGVTKTIRASEEDAGEYDEDNDDDIDYDDNEYDGGAIVEYIETDVSALGGGGAGGVGCDKKSLNIMTIDGTTVAHESFL